MRRVALLFALMLSSGTVSAAPVTLSACHGFGCHFATPVRIDGRAAARLKGFFAGRQSASQERRSIGRAVAYFETLATAAIGIADRPKSTHREFEKKGQMDCIDESTNTRTLLTYLAKNGLLRHHKVGSNVTRGFLIDNRYPHSTAVVRDPDGVAWAIDSWYEAAGKAPDIMVLADWMKRGVGGER